jgi:hypothetical protein
VAGRHRGAWLFLTTPVQGQTLARGIHLAVWMMSVPIPYLMLLVAASKSPRSEPFSRAKRNASNVPGVGPVVIPVIIPMVV